MNWLELWAKIQVISSIIGWVLVGLVILFWFIVIIVKIFIDKGVIK